MSPAIKDAPKKTAKPAPALPGGFAGQILRVDLSKRKCWGEPWGSAAEMRDQLGGIGLGSRILYKETRKGKGNVSWDHPDNRLILATLDSNEHLAVRRRVVERIAEQVLEDLPEPFRIGVHGYGLGWPLELNAVA